MVVRKRAVIGAVSLSLGISESCFGSAGTGRGCSLLHLQIVPGVGGGGDKRATDGVREEFRKQCTVLVSMNGSGHWGPNQPVGGF